tara:strand:- start:164 stop:1858 length:1695 start_codon:yes stop_codon:yes gene_type:complete
MAIGFSNTDINGTLSISGSYNLPTIDTGISGQLGEIGMFNGVPYFYSNSGWQSISGSVSSPTPTAVGIEYLVVAGGGGGGSSGAGSGAGGAGGLLSSSISPSNAASGSTFTVTVGAAGAGGTGTGYGNHGANGQNSSISYNSITTTVTGGGGGSGGNQVGSSGGSGGGGNGGYATAGGSGTTGQGDDGGDGTYNSGGSGQDAYAGGGGGGASQVGSDGFANATSEIGGTGGTGLASNITGTSTHYAGGGGGGAGYRRTTTAGVAGTGGGGTGASSQTSDATAGTANTGGGGGGGGGYTSNPNGGSSRNGKNGGAGVAIFAYDSGSAYGAGGIVGAAGDGRKYHQFNSSGTLKMGSNTDYQIHTSNLQLHLDAGDFSSRGTSTWTDLSGNSRNGSVSGATLGTNFYYDFDGSNDLVTFNATQNSATKAFEVWLNPDTFGGDGWVFGQGDGQGTENFIRVYGSGIMVRMGNRGAVITYSTTNTWLHIVATHKSSSGMEIYFNGVKVGENTTALATVQNNYFQLGARHNGSMGMYFDGKIGQVRTYTSALTQAQIIQNYNATKTNFV